MKDQIKTFPEKQKPREFIANIHALQAILKKPFRVKEINIRQ